MEYLLKRISYLQGLCDGYDLDTTTNEGKIISELVDILSDVIDEMRESREEIEDYVDIIEAVSYTHLTLPTNREV